MKKLFNCNINDYSQKAFPKDENYYTICIVQICTPCAFIYYNIFMVNIPYSQ